MSKAPTPIAVVYPDGSIESVLPPDGGQNWTLEHLQKIVGGYIEVKWNIPGYPHKTVAIFNEEGVPLDLPRNAMATTLVGIPLRGNVILAQSSVLG